MTFSIIKSRQRGDLPQYTNILLFLLANKQFVEQRFLHSAFFGVLLPLRRYKQSPRGDKRVRNGGKLVIGGDD